MISHGVFRPSALTCALARPGDEAKTHQDVWVVRVLADGTMVTGDGGGKLQFWDAVHGSLVASFSQHRADILALAASKDGKTVFASGVDSQLALFQRIPDTLGEQQCTDVL